MLAVFDNLVCFLKIGNFFKGKSVIKNIINATLKIVGPVEVFQIIEEYKPKITDITPTILAIIAIWMGVVDKFLEIDAGMIKSPVINKIPTILIEMAITAAINKVKIAFANSGLSPSALANSKFTVPANKGLHIIINKNSTIAPPIQTIKISLKLTDRMSPNSKPIKSILIKESRPKVTSPTAKTE